MTEAKQGVLAMIMACMIWGLSPLYYKLLTHIPPIEVLAHRTIWSAVIFTGLLTVQRRVPDLRRALFSGRDTAIIGFAALMISSNWFVFIWSIGNNKATEASLGYFLFPLVAVLFGRVIFAESLSRAQWLSILIASGAVVILTAGLGIAPWIAIIIAATFGLYGVVKKRLSVGPVVSVTAEVTLLVPIAIAVLVYFHGTGRGQFGQDMTDGLLLILSGVLTATPLMLFSFAAKRAALSTVGLLQYLNPTLQFFCAVVIFGEPFGLWHAISFPLIWLALAIYSVAAWRQERARANAASSAAISSTT